MKELYTVKYRLYSVEGREGIFVFLVNERYQEGDLLKNINCSEPLSWVASLKELNEFINKADGDRELVKRFISKMIRKRSNDKIERLLQLYPKKRCITNDGGVGNIYTTDSGGRLF